MNYAIQKYMPKHVHKSIYFEQQPDRPLCNLIKEAKEYIKLNKPKYHKFAQNEDAVSNVVTSLWIAEQKWHPNTNLSLHEFKVKYIGWELSKINSSQKHYRCLKEDSGIYNNIEEWERNHDNTISLNKISNKLKDQYNYILDYLSSKSPRQFAQNQGESYYRVQKNISGIILRARQACRQKIGSVEN